MEIANFIRVINKWVNPLVGTVYVCLCYAKKLKKSIKLLLRFQKYLPVFLICPINTPFSRGPIDGTNQTDRIQD